MTLYKDFGNSFRNDNNNSNSSYVGLNGPRFLKDNRIQYYTIDSTERVDYLNTDTNNIQIIMPSTIDKIKTIQLEYFAMPNILYNISTHLKNNKLGLVVGINNYTITLPDGAYTLTTLINTLKTLLNAITNPNLWTITYNTTTLLLTFSMGINFQFDLTLSNAMYLILGFKPVITNSTTTLTADYPFQLQGITEVFINLENYPSLMFSSTLNCNFCVPVFVNTGELILYARNNNMEQTNFYNSFNNKSNILNIQLIDHYGRLIQTNHANWRMVMGITYYD